MFDSSAPESPGVPFAMRSRSTPWASGILRVCTRRICSRPFTSGMSTTIWRSKRPGRNSAGSRMSGRFVAASRMTPSFDSNPSISTSSWFKVCSRSSWPPPSPAPRCRPTASISSMKMMHGACAFPCSNRSRTREAPTPTNISTKSEPDIEKKGRPASPATALASSVLPVPGGPTRSAPLGSRPPSRWNFWGSLRKSMISSSSCFASSHPALQVPLDLLALGDLDGVDVCGFQLLGELGERDVRLLPAVLGELQQRDRAHDEERPERERPQGAGPVEVAGRREAVRHLAQARDVRQVAEVLGVIEPVPHEEAARRVEAHEARLQHQALGHVLVQQGTDLQALRVPLSHQRHQPIDGLPRIHDVLDQQDMLTPQLRLRIVQQPDAAARNRVAAVACRDEEVDLQRSVDAPHQVAEEDEAPLEQPEHEQLAVGVGGRDVAAELRDPARDRLLVEHHAGQLAPACLPTEARRPW